MHLSPWKLSNVYVVSTWMGDQVVAHYSVFNLKGCCNAVFMIVSLHPPHHSSSVVKPLQKENTGPDSKDLQTTQLFFLKFWSLSFNA